MRTFWTYPPLLKFSPGPLKEEGQPLVEPVEVIPAADVRAVLEMIEVRLRHFQPHDVRIMLSIVQQALGQEGSPQEPAVEEEHVCGMQGFGALGDVCPPCHRAYERAVRRGQEGRRDGATRT
jgi:hypothetical protein